MKTKNIYTTMINVFNKSRVITATLFTTALVASCVVENNIEVAEQQGNVGLDTRSLTEEMLNHTNLYVFDNAANPRFIRKQLNVTKDKDENILTTNMTAGTWQLGIVTCDSEDITINPQFNIPTPYTDNMVEAPMWVTGKKSSGYLNQTPEILYVPLRGVDIVANQTKTIKKDEAQLVRNVAMVQFVLQDHEGFSGITEGVNTNAFIDLLEVPTTISWEGKYLPSKNSPATSTVALRENLKFQNKSGKMVADIVNFIIPAHRGDNENDTTMHKLSFQIAIPLTSGDKPFYGKSENPIKLSFTPKINKILRVNIKKFSGEPETEMDMEISVKDWHDWIDQNKVFD